MAFLQNFTLQIAFVIICFAIILIAVFLDLNSGIRKAKKKKRICFILQNETNT